MLFLDKMCGVALDSWSKGAVLQFQSGKRGGAVALQGTCNDGLRFTDIFSHPHDLFVQVKVPTASDHVPILQMNFLHHQAGKFPAGTPDLPKL